MVLAPEPDVLEESGENGGVWGSAPKFFIIIPEVWQAHHFFFKP